MRHDTPARRAWLLEHQDATIREAAARWNVADNLIRQDEKALGIVLRRVCPQRKPHGKATLKSVDHFNPLANAFIRGELR